MKQAIQLLYYYLSKGSRVGTVLAPVRKAKLLSSFPAKENTVGTNYLVILFGMK